MFIFHRTKFIFRITKSPLDGKRKQSESSEIFQKNQIAIVTPARNGFCSSNRVGADVSGTLQQNAIFGTVVGAEKSDLERNQLKARPKRWQMQGKVEESERFLPEVHQTSSGDGIDWQRGSSPRVQTRNFDEFSRSRLEKEKQRRRKAAKAVSNWKFVRIRS